MRRHKPVWKDHPRSNAKKEKREREEKTDSVNFTIQRDRATSYSINYDTDKSSGLFRKHHPCCINTGDVFYNQCAPSSKAVTCNSWQRRLWTSAAARRSAACLFAPISPMSSVFATSLARASFLPYAIWNRPEGKQTSSCKTPRSPYSEHWCHACRYSKFNRA